MKNKAIAGLLYEIAELLTLNNESIFRIRAYERAAQTLDTMAESVDVVAREGRLRDIAGIGESIAEKIEEYLASGKIAYHEELAARFPQGLLEMMAVPGVGPKKARALFDRLHISSVPELEAAAGAGKIRTLAGFGKKSEDNILKSIATQKQSAGRMLLSEALALSKEIMAQCSGIAGVSRMDAAGSLRRYRETIGDVDILCAATESGRKKAIERFTSLAGVERVLAAGPEKSSVVFEGGVQADMRVIEPASYGAALQYFTGSKAHNVTLRTLAKRKGFTINEYGIFRIGEKAPVAAKTEEEVYAALGLDWIAPELREDTGEIEAAATGALPRLVELKDIKGDVHVHSTYSDGKNSIEEMAAEAQRRGYEWIIITDHSQSLKIARGLSVETMRKKLKEIERLNARYTDFRILCGTEIDILSHGNLDYPRSVLEELDFVLASIHTGFKQDEETITGRVTKALENKFTHCLGHPTGRLIGKRPAYALNMERVLDTARRAGKMIEINSFPERLDLADVYCRKAKELRVKLAIGTDAHTTGHLGFMELGISVARRGWLEKNDIINTLSYKELMEYLKKRREHL
ncbi:MAG: hypothetical protein A2219_03740 [Elusimicrobia bacterium RIFOXYA2_FULL_50_26]|nr:MAG: hypothetical protein A2219_03740 [Elusimicrobia bacterium RIFOXYA2_FULL_50_26]